MCVDVCMGPRSRAALGAQSRIGVCLPSRVFAAHVGWSESLCVVWFYGGLLCAGFTNKRDDPKIVGYCRQHTGCRGAHRAAQHRATGHCQAPRVAMLAVRRSACFCTTVGLCETTIFFLLLLLYRSAPARKPYRLVRTRTCMQTRCCTCLDLSIIDCCILFLPLATPVGCCRRLVPLGGLLDRKLWC